MIDIIDEFTNHVETGVDMLADDFFQEGGSDADWITLSRDARKQLREWHRKFSAILEAVDEQEQVLRIMPYDAPGKHHGEPAYDVDGMQMLVEVVDNLPENRFRAICHQALSWDDDDPDVARKNKKIRKLYTSVYAVREGKAERPVPVV